MLQIYRFLYKKQSFFRKWAIFAQNKYYYHDFSLF